MCQIPLNPTKDGICRKMNHKKKPYMILGSLQAHAVKTKVEGGVSPCIGTTDFGLPKVIEIVVYEDVFDCSNGRR